MEEDQIYIHVQKCKHLKFKLRGVFQLKIIPKTNKMNPAKEFTIDLISNASMENFGDNTMSKFRNQLAQPLILDGE